MKKDCDNCKYFNKGFFENHLGLPCTNEVMKKDLVAHNFWVFYFWAKGMDLFSCKGFDEETRNQMD